MNPSEQSFFTESLTIKPVIDPELKTIEAIVELVVALSYPARVRVLNYVGARINPDGL
jgi:hypothetical protein